MLSLSQGDTGIVFFDLAPPLKLRRHAVVEKEICLLYITLLPYSIA